MTRNLILDWPNITAGDVQLYLDGMKQAAGYNPSLEGRRMIDEVERWLRNRSVSERVSGRIRNLVERIKNGV